MYQKKSFNTYKQAKHQNWKNIYNSFKKSKLNSNEHWNKTNKAKTLKVT